MFTASRLSRIALALVALVVAGTVAAALPPSAAAAAQWQSYQLDGDRCWDASILDADFNGHAEQVWFDLDNDCRWDTRQYNTRYADNFHEEISYDLDENGVPEYVIQDIDQRVGFEWVYIDLNQDRRFELKRVIPGSSLDHINRANNRTMKVMTASQMFHFATMTGQSLLYPTFRMP